MHTEQELEQAKRDYGQHLKDQPINLLLRLLWFWIFSLYTLIKAKVTK